MSCHHVGQDNILKVGIMPIDIHEVAILEAACFKVPLAFLSHK